jgi:hypothetical protein
MNKLRTDKLIVPLGLALLAAGAAAQVPAGTTRTGNAVVVGGTPILRVYVAVAGFSPHQRAAAVQERLNRILALGPIHASDIAVAAQGKDAAVRVKGRLLFTETSADGRYARTTALVLANQFAGRMRATLPELTQAK